jgi:hypothetical protein
VRNAATKHHVPQIAASEHRHGEIARLVISIIILVVAAWTGFRLAPTSSADVFEFIFAKQQMILTIFSAIAFVNVTLYILGAFGRRPGDHERLGRFWP